MIGAKTNSIYFRQGSPALISSTGTMRISGVKLYRNSVVLRLTVGTGLDI